MSGEPIGDPASAASGIRQGRGRRQRLVRWLGEETRRLLILFVYLWVLFGLFVLNEQIILRQRGIAFAPQRLSRNGCGMIV